MADDGNAGTATAPAGGATGAADPNATTPPAATDPGTADPGTGDAPKDLTSDVEKWKALARKHETRAKENAAAATKLAELENANKTELQKAQDRAAAAEAKSAEADSARYRLLAAAGNGLGPDLVDFLGNGTEDEITERAKALSAVIKSEADKMVDAVLAQHGVTRSGQNGTANSAAAAASLGVGRRPVESLRPGSVPAGDHTAAAGADNNTLFRQMYERQARA